MKFLRRITIFVLSVTTLLGAVTLFAPIPLSFPDASLDPGWELSMNQAMADGKVFGRDIMFTYGPYASADSRQFHPATGRSMVLIDLLLGLSYGAGLLCLGHRRKLWLAAVLPCAVFVAAGWREPLFLSVPLLHLLVTDRFAAGLRRPGNAATPTLLLVTLAGLTLSMGLLPLVKGSFAIVTGALGACAFVTMYRVRRSHAWAGAILFLGALVGGWLAAGQPIAALPQYFVALLPIVAGYTDAMSFGSDATTVIVYIAVAILLLAIEARLSVKDREFLVLAGAAITLFVAMKEGFVRYDLGHGPIAAAGLILIGGLMSMRLSTRTAGLVVAVTVCGWALIAQNDVPIGPTALVQRTAFDLALIRDDLSDRLHGRLQTQFDAGLAKIRADYPLTRRHGPADIYPIDQELLIANGLTWSPRPILQSYSAFSPALSDLNLAHLTRPEAPDWIYFRPGTIDGRLPALDDGQSWPVLATQYQIVARESGYAVLKRTPAAGSALPPAPAGSTIRFGEAIPLPPDASPLWAEIDVRPTWLGRIVNTLYKLPPLHLGVTFADGRQAQYRYIAGMGRSGFLLSPVIESTEQFIALLSPYRTVLLENQRLTAFSLAPGGWGLQAAKWLWQSDIGVRFRRFDPPVQPAASRFLFDPWLATPPAGLTADTAASAQCNFDHLSIHSAADHPVVEADGWAAVSTTAGIAPDQIDLVITEPNGMLHVAKARINARPDVNDFFHQPKMGPTGFAALLEMPPAAAGSSVRLAVLHDGERTYCAFSKPLSAMP